jgi:hypothetical protein
VALHESIDCFDRATSHCQCALGRSLNCSYCTRLRPDAGRCECDWSGACVLLAGETGANAPLVRRRRRGRAVATRELGRGVRELVIAAPRGVTTHLGYPGRFVFVRPAGLDHSYDVPLTVLSAGERNYRLWFAVQGPKTQALAAVREGGTVFWRGPYQGGLLGWSRARRAARRPGGAAVIIARGLGIVPALPLARYMAAAAGWRVSLLQDRPPAAGGLGDGGGLAAMLPQDVALGKIAAYTPAAGALLAETLRNVGWPGPSIVASCGTDVLHRWVARWWSELPEAGRPLLVASNNALMTCGEGSCGACAARMPGGGRYRGCKSDIAPEKAFGQGGR